MSTAKHAYYSRVVFGFVPPGFDPSKLPKRTPGVDASVDKHEGEPTSMFGQVGQGIADFASGIGHEGLSGLLDFGGMMDRADARRDLAKKFSVVDNAADARLPNQVTSAQYDQIASTYSNIRRGRTDLQIDGSASSDPGQFKADMMDDIGDIMQTRSGRDLIGKLANNVNHDEAGNAVHRTTTLSPFLTAAGAPDNKNAKADIDHEPGVGAPFEDGRPGIGADAGVRVNPNLDVETSKVRYRSDVALFHEMVHALHGTRGTNDMSHVQSTDGVARELRKGSAFGALGELLHLDDMRIDADSKHPLSRHEHQAAGLGLYADDRVTENAYRRERGAVAWSGKGMAGDLLMQERQRYTRSNARYTPFFGL